MNFSKNLFRMEFHIYQVEALASLIAPIKSVRISEIRVKVLTSAQFLPQKGAHPLAILKIVQIKLLVR
jgi:hypothetical protein